jgi:hypothetical protein
LKFSRRTRNQSTYGHRGDRYLDEVWVELGAFTFLQFRNNDFEGEPLSVRTIRRHRVDRVRNKDDA